MSDQTSEIIKIKNKIPFQEAVQLCEISKFYCQAKNLNINTEKTSLTNINVNIVTQNESLQNVKSDKIPISDRIYNTKSLCGNN
jgi:hypothetical protein